MTNPIRFISYHLMIMTLITDWLIDDLLRVSKYYLVFKEYKNHYLQYNM